MKRKIAGLFILFFVFLMPGVFAAAETDTITWNRPDCGVELVPPPSWTESGYYFEFGKNGELSKDVILSSAVFYNGTEEDIEASLEEYGDGPDFYSYINEHFYSAFFLLSVRDSLSEEEVLETVKSAIGDDPSTAITEVSHTDGWIFYDLSADSLNTRPEPFEGTEETVEQILADIPEVYRNSRFFQPDVPDRIEEGDVLSFETVDSDGNEISSAELFAQNRFTLVNLWTSWCTYCIQEMPELEEMSRDFSEDHGGVVGILLDGDEDAALETGMKIAEEAGVTFRILLPTQEMKDQLPCSGYPTTVFVDQEGVVVGDPIEGMQPDKYRERMTGLLASVSDEETEEERPGSAQDQEGSSEAKEQGYCVRTEEEDGTPVPGVIVQFCSDSLCMTETTGEDGAAYFDQEAGLYTVHLLQVPEGYREDTEEYTAPEEPGTIVIRLDKDTSGN